MRSAVLESDLGSGFGSGFGSDLRSVLGPDSDLGLGLGLERKTGVHVNKRTMAIAELLSLHILLLKVLVMRVVNWDDANHVNLPEGKDKQLRSSGL